jgi:hypothetical protein
MSPIGICFEIDTRAVETTLRAWFDEVLPWTFEPGRPGDDFDVIYPRINIWPMWAWKPGPPSDPDWLTDSRVLGRIEEFRATDGETGLKALLELRQKLERELRELSDRPGQ